MRDRLAFSFQCCDRCVDLIRRLLKKRQPRQWWEIEAYLHHHIKKHPGPRKRIVFYSNLSKVPACQDKELTGWLFVDSQTISDEIFANLQDCLDIIGSMDIRLVNDIIWTEHFPHWLNVEIHWVDQMIYAKVSAIEMDVDQALSEI
jgi:hypothetical protein